MENIGKLKNISLDEKIRILCEIINSLNNDETDGMKDILFEKGAINFEEKKAMQGGNIKKTLLAFVETAKNEKALDKFFKAYNETHAEVVENILSMNDLYQEDSSAGKDSVDGLKATDSEPIESSCASNKNNTSTVKSASKPPEKPYDWYLRDQELQQTLMTQANASQLHQCFGHNWQEIMLQLGFRSSAVELELENSGHRTQRVITNLIIKWIQREGREATYGKFIKVLINYCKNGGDIDWPALKSIVPKT